MLIHPTVERLRALGLSAMADAFIEMQNAPEAAELTREDWLGLLVDREATSRENKRLARRLREAKLRQAAVVEDVNLRAPRGLDRALFQKLATCEWVRDHHHLLVVGPTGIGKSWLACALGHKALYGAFDVKGAGAGLLISFSGPRGACHWGRSLAPRPCIRLDPCGPDHEAVVRFEGEAPSWWAHSADGVIARPCAGFTATSDRRRQPIASARLDVEG
jgi:IstB-like ATP binding protein